MSDDPATPRHVAREWRDAHHFQIERYDLTPELGGPRGPVYRLWVDGVMREPPRRHGVVRDPWYSSEAAAFEAGHAIAVLTYGGRIAALEKKVEELMQRVGVTSCTTSQGAAPRLAEGDD